MCWHFILTISFKVCCVNENFPCSGVHHGTITLEQHVQVCPIDFLQKITFRKGFHLIDHFQSLSVITFPLYMIFTLITLMILFGFNATPSYFSNDDFLSGTAPFIIKNLIISRSSIQGRRQGKIQGVQSRKIQLENNSCCASAKFEVSK